MGLKNNKSSSTSEGWGMGFLFVFFPSDQNQNQNQEQQEEEEEEKINLSSTFKRTNSTNLFQKAQSTISICLLLLFTTLLLFTLSALPSTTPTTRRIYTSPRRQLNDKFRSNAPPNAALQGMGTLFRKGTRAMTQLVIAHADDSLTVGDLEVFVRLFYRSEISSRSDLLLLFQTKMASFEKAVISETTSFHKLVTRLMAVDNSSGIASFDVTRFVKSDESVKESIWGPRFRGNFTESARGESTRYGSVVGFDVEELDPGDSLSGFLDRVPMGLRRWACYPMLLGRVKKYFKHVMLVDMKEVLVLGDPFARVRKRTPESVVLSVAKHGKKPMERKELARKKMVDPGVIAGGARGVRMLSKAILMDIVRAAERKEKDLVTELDLFNRFGGNERVLKNVNLAVSSDLIPELGSRVRLDPDSVSHLLAGNNETVIRRGDRNLDVNSLVMKHICSFPLDSEVYSDC